MSKKKTTKKKKKTPAWKTTARELSNAEYAGILEQLDQNKSTNRKSYDEYVKQRQESLGKQIGSDKLATSITGNAVIGLKKQSMGEFDRAAATNQAARTLRDKANTAANSNALSNYEAEMKARGISAPQSAAMKANLQTQQGLATGLDAIDASYQDSIKKNAGQNYDSQYIWAKSLGNSFESNARGAATSDFNEHYNTYVEKRDTLAAEIAKAKKDRGSSYLNTALTLKKEAQQAAAEKAARKLAAAAAQSNASSSDYFRSVSADQAQQRINLSKDKYLSDLQVKVNSGKLSVAKAIIQARKDGIELPSNFWDDLTGTKGSNINKNDPRYKKIAGML